MTRVTKGILTLAFWALVCAAVLLAGVVLLSRVSMPLVDRYRPQIESNLTQLTGMQVHVGALHAALNGINIDLNASEIALDTESQAGAVVIDRLDFELDVARSLFTLSPQFRNVVVSGVEVLLRENGEGRVTLLGAGQSTQSEGDIAASRILNYVAELRQVALTDVRVSLESPRFERIQAHIPATYLINQHSKKLIQSDIFINDIQEPIVLKGQISTDLTNFLQQQVVAQIQVPGVTIPLDWLDIEGLDSIKSLFIEGQYWVTYQPGKGVSAQAQDSQFEAMFSDGKKLAVGLDWRFKQSREGVSFALSNLLLDDGVNTVEGVHLKGEWESRDSRSYIIFNKMDAQLVTALALRFVPQDWRLSRLLLGLNPKGEAKNASLRIWHTGEKLRYQYLSNLVDAEISGHNGIPAVNHVNGVFSLTDAGGNVQFTSQASQLAFPTLYEEPWSIREASGEVTWGHLGTAFVVSGENLRILRGDSTIQGQFRLQQPDDDGVGESWLALDINAQNIAMRDKLTFVPPRALSDSLRSWLNTALQDGSIDDVDLLLRTGLRKGDQPIIRLAANTVVERLEFDKKWPAATNVVGKVLVNSDQVNVDVVKADFVDLPVTDLNVVVPIKDGKADRLEVNGAFQNSAQRIVSTLNQTPLRESVLAPFSDWSVAGELTGRFDVSVPLLAEAGEPKADVALEFADNAIMVQPISLNGEIKQGSLHYNSQDGLHDTHFIVESLGGESSLTLSSSRSPDNVMIIAGSLQGVADVQQLAHWRSAPKAVVDRLAGMASYQGKLAINRSQVGQVDLSVQSDLTGVSLAFPEPFKKSGSLALPITIELKSFEKELLLDANAEGLLYSKLLFENGVVQGGSVSLFRPQSESNLVKKGVSFAAQMDEFQWRDWESFVGDLSGEQQNEAASKPMETQLPSWLRSLDVLVDHLPVNQQNELSNVKLSYAKSLDGHPLTITSDELNAELKRTDAGPELHIAYLNWRTKQADEQGSAEEIAIEPNIFPSMQVRIDELYIDNQPYGDWRGHVVNMGNRLRIEDISTRLSNGTFWGEVFWQGGHNPNVEAAIKVLGDDAQELTQKFAATPFIRSKNYKIDVALSWDKSLLAFDRASLNGRIRFDVRDGNFNQIDRLPPFLRILGVFNVDALAKRLTFDFSDLYEPGMPFDRFSSLLTIREGILETSDPLRVVSPTAEVRLEGKANLINETLDERLTATVPITSSLPVAGLLLGTPQIAGLLYITDKLIGDQLSKVTSIQYQIKGPFSAPEVTPVQYSPGK